MEIPLSNGMVAVIDDEDFALVSQYNWSATKNGTKWYAATYKGSKKARRKIYMHRLIKGEPEGVLVDHRDGDGLNNRRGNLRDSDRSLNGANSGLSRRNKSGIKGVRWDAPRKRWHASITVGGKVRHLGRFIEKDAAAQAYAAAAIAVHGEFARPSHEVH